MYELYDGAGFVSSTTNKTKIKRDMKELSPQKGKWIIRISVWSSLGWVLTKIIMKFI